MPKKKNKITKNISDKFDFTSQDMYDKLIKAINKYCDEERVEDIIKHLDDLIDYIFMYW